MRQFASGKVLTATDYSNGTTALTVSANCPGGCALNLRSLKVACHVEFAPTLNKLDERSYLIERLRDGEVIASTRYVLDTYGKRHASDGFDVIRIDAVNDLQTIVGTDLRVRFDGKDGCEGQMILMQFECIDPTQAPYTVY